MRKEKGKMKAKKLLVEMLIIVSFVSAFGFWAMGEWRKRYPEPVKIEKQVKVYQGKWHKTYLEVMK